MMSINTDGLVKINTKTMRAFVFKMIALNPQGLTRNEIAVTTGMRLCSVCARANELMKSGRLAEDGKRLNKESGVMVNILHAVS